MLRAHAPRALASNDALEQTLGEIVRAAREAWPEIALPPGVFIPYLAQHVPAGQPAERALRRMHAIDLYLACACARGDEAAIAVFERRCLSVVDRALSKWGMTADGVAEVKQRLRFHLLVGNNRPPGICSFSGRGDLRGWVCVIAVRKAQALTRRASREVPLDDGVLTRALTPSEGPEMQHIKHQCRLEFTYAFDRALMALRERERTLLRQRFMDGLNIDQLGDLYGVHRATAARWLERARRQVLELTLAALEEKLQLQRAEVASVVSLIASDLEVSLDFLSHRNQPRQMC